MRKPDFIVVGTQKAGTTWLRDNLFRHPNVSGVTKQIHFFDKYFRKGLSWYCNHFANLSKDSIVGEKTTEYFDTTTASIVAERLAQDFPETRIIIVLRNPVERAFSALQHTVTMGRDKLPKDANKLIFEDRERGFDGGFRYIERGFYAQQIESYLQYIPLDRMLILIFEEDIIAKPRQGLRRTFAFLGVDEDAIEPDAKIVNARRLSKVGIWLMRKLCRVPFARSFIWRIDTWLPLKRWEPKFTQETRDRLRAIYRPENERLFQLLGRSIEGWR